MAFHHHLIEGLYYPLKAVKTLARPLGLVSRNSLRVLTYHDISAEEQAQFVSQLRWLSRSWRFLSPNQFAALISGDEPVGSRNLLLTFDDGFASHRRIAHEVLNPMGISALFFIPSEFVSGDSSDEAAQRGALHAGKLPANNMTWSDVGALLEQGHSIGAHTATHARLSELHSEAELEREIVASADALARRLGVPIEHFAYSFGDIASFSPRALAVARSRFRFIYSGLRGDNARRTSPSTLWRDAVTPRDSLTLLSAYLEGTADFHYAQSRAELASWL
jgi:peptidoglycan/xylan/chitin deacetylase (PgdA/CDA1 family)